MEYGDEDGNGEGMEEDDENPYGQEMMQAQQDQYNHYQQQ
jgi:hypothetical protein